MPERITATYHVETALPLAAVAQVMAGEQSTGTFVPVPGETEALRARHGAQVERVVEGGSVTAPSLPGALASGTGKWRHGEVVLSWPLANIGPSLPNLLATIAGNLFELQQLSGLRLLDITLPPAFAAAYPGPQFGIAGTRGLAGVTHRPLIGTIVKPSVGLSPAETAARVESLCEAGIDFIKDDELQANGPHCPLTARVDAVMAVIDSHAQRSGKRVMYAFNITDELDAMRRHHDHVLAAGGTCVMVSLHSMGFAGLTDLRRYCQVPIHGHRNGWGYLSRHPQLGFSYVAWQKLWRLAGVDHLHVNGLRNKFCEPNDSVLASARACLAPLFDDESGYQAMPVFSSGQWAGQAAETFEALGSVDLIYACGGGIMAHPGGIGAGVASIRQAWEAAVTGVPMAEYAASHGALRQAIDRFGE